MKEDGGRRRSPRGARGGSRKHEALGPVDNPYPPLDILTPDGLARIVDRAYRLLEEGGLEFRSARALAILKGHGARCR